MATPPQCGGCPVQPQDSQTPIGGSASSSIGADATVSAGVAAGLAAYGLWGTRSQWGSRIARHDWPSAFRQTLRVVEAYDALLIGNITEYKMKMATAIVQMGYGRDIRPSDRPTAVDVIRTIVQQAVADMWLTTFQIATAKLQRMLTG